MAVYARCEFRITMSLDEDEKEGHAQRASVEENISIPITPPKAKQ